MRTAVVILNWNTRDFLERFLPPLLDSVRGLDAGVVVADNASADGSRELLAERFPQVRTILLAENFGFTGGYNRAFGELLEGDAPEYLVLLNSDVLVQPGWLEPLVEYGASPRSAIALALGAKAAAFTSGRAYVVPQDVKDIACDVLRHRVVPSYEAEAEDMTSDDIINRLLDELHTP